LNNKKKDESFVFFSKELWSISATSNRQGDEEIYARGSHIIWTYPLRDIQCPSYMEFTTDTIPKKVKFRKKNSREFDLNIFL